MGNRLNKIYEKAMDYYQKGNINRALEQCEKGIALDLKEGKLLNLKGMLLYLKGDLKGAVSAWKINSDYNNDEIAKVYLKDAKKDEEGLRLYSLVEIDLKELKIDEALGKLAICQKSDFNAINVNNALAICYLRKTDYLKAIEFVEKALTIDKESKTALEIKNQINDYLEDPKEEFKRSLKKKFIIFTTILISSILIFSVVKNQNKNRDTLQVVEESGQNQIVEENIVIEEKEEKQEIKKLNSAEEIEKAYETAINLYDEEKYEEVVINLLAAYNSELETYYDKHVLFLLASAYFEKDDLKEAIKYYEEYINKYDETYLEEIYYKLALSYEESDINKSKEYASHIQKQYNKSIYNNSKIAEIINK